MSRVSRILGAGALAGAGAAAYSLLEAKSFRLTSHRLEVAPGTPRLRVFHISDTHLKARDRALIEWLDELPRMLGNAPDLVVATGDMIGDNSGIEPLLGALSNLTAKLGRFYVFGSHDYYQATFDGYVKYFTGNRDKVRAETADTAALEDGLTSQGWTGLTNRTEVLDTSYGAIRLAGVDDPYLNRQRIAHIRRGKDDVLAIGLTHAPQVVSEWFLRGFDLVLAGHTHGGQVRVPVLGALVTNSDLPAALAAGPQRVGYGWLHVSPGLGTGKFAPIRFNCPPEATVLELDPESS